MSLATYDAAMVRIFADEGGYTNDPKDPGGPTNWGITIYDARKYWKADATAADVKAMPKEVASSIYRKHYAVPIRYDDLPAGFDYSVFDAAINSGTGRAIPWAGQALNTNNVTIEPIVAYAKLAPDKVSLIQKYWQLRLSFLHGLKTWSHFGKGWGRRCAQGEAAAVRMWLTIGANLPAVDVRKKLDQESDKAKTQSKKAATAGAGSAGSTIVPAAGLESKILIGICAALLIAAAIYFIRQAYIHNQRAAAYKAA